MPFRIIHTPLVAEHGRKLAGRVKDVGKFLADPPTVFAPRAIVVVAAPHPVERARVQDVAVLVQNRAVAAAIHGDLAVPVELAAHNFQIGAGHLIVANQAYQPEVGAVRHLRPRSFHPLGLRQSRRLRCRAEIDLVCVQIVVIRIRFRAGHDTQGRADIFAKVILAAIVGRTHLQQFTRARRDQRRTVVEQVIGMVQKNRAAPGLPVEGHHLLGPNRAQDAPPDGMRAAESQPDAPGLVHRQARQGVSGVLHVARGPVRIARLGVVGVRIQLLKVVLHSSFFDLDIRHTGQHRSQVGGRLHGAPIRFEPAQTNDAPLIHRHAVGVIGPEVLSPPFAAFLVRHPQPPAAVVSDTRVRFVARTGRHRCLRPPGAARSGAHINVVVLVAIRIPRHRHAPGLIRGDRRIPFIPGRLRNRGWRAELAAALGSREDRRLAAAPALPCHPHIAA